VTFRHNETLSKWKYTQWSECRTWNAALKASTMHQGDCHMFISNFREASEKYQNLIKHQNRFTGCVAYFVSSYIVCFQQHHAVTYYLYREEHLVDSMRGPELASCLLTLEILSHFLWLFRCIKWIEYVCSGSRLTAVMPRLKLKPINSKIIVGFPHIGIVSWWNLWRFFMRTTSSLCLLTWQ
jgi:hypothetical protein